jgi:hypothetical protein
MLANSKLEVMEFECNPTNKPEKQKKIQKYILPFDSPPLRQINEHFDLSRIVPINWP